MPWWHIYECEEVQIVSKEERRRREPYHVFDKYVEQKDGKV